MENINNELPKVRMWREVLLEMIQQLPPDHEFAGLTPEEVMQEYQRRLLKKIFETQQKIVKKLEQQQKHIKQQQALEKIVERQERMEQWLEHMEQWLENVEEKLDQLLLLFKEKTNKDK